jgi:hypothetical protein
MVTVRYLSGENPDFNMLYADEKDAPLEVHEFEVPAANQHVFNEAFTLPRSLPDGPGVFEVVFDSGGGTQGYYQCVDVNVSPFSAASGLVVRLPLLFLLVIAMISVLL